MKTFSDAIKGLRKGQADIDAGLAVAELVQAVRETGRSGSILLELKVAPIAKGNGEQVIVTDVVKVKKPMPHKGETVLFTTDENDLQAKDPRQPELSGLREVKVHEFKQTGEATTV